MYALSDDFLRELIDPGAGCSVEYCLIGIEGLYLGERSHREAISLAMERFLADCEDAWQDASRATARPVPASRVLELPEAVLQGKLPAHGTGLSARQRRPLSERHETAAGFRMVGRLVVVF